MQNETVRRGRKRVDGTLERRHLRGKGGVEDTSRSRASKEKRTILSLFSKEDERDRARSPCYPFWFFLCFLAAFPFSQADFSRLSRIFLSISLSLSLSLAHTRTHLSLSYSCQGLSEQKSDRYAEYQDRLKRSEEVQKGDLEALEENYKQKLETEVKR